MTVDQLSISRHAASLALWLSAACALAGCGKAADAQSHDAPRAAPVGVVPAVQRSVIDSEEFSGRIEATDFVELRPRVAGLIDKVHFADGELVAKNQLLFTIDPRPFAAEVARAQAQLVSAQAKAGLAKTERARAQSLLESQAVSRQEFDQLAAGERTSEADIRAARAALQTAELSLGFSSVRAPIAGRVSRANVTAGNLVGDQVVLTTIAGVSRLYAYFDSSEQTYLRIRALPDRSPKVLMGLANENGFPHEGRIDFVDNRLNAQTGAIRMRASFDNARNQFVPGLAAHLKMPTSATYDAVLVPERAIGTDQTKKTVFVVGTDGMPQPREVKTGAQFGGMRVVQGGVKPGENVIVEGLQRVIPGMPVAPTVLPTDAQGLPLPPPPPAAASAGGAPASAPRKG